MALGRFISEYFSVPLSINISPTITPICYLSWAVHQARQDTTPITASVSRRGVTFWLGLRWSRDKNTRKLSQCQCVVYSRPQTITVGGITPRPSSSCSSNRSSSSSSSSISSSFNVNKTIFRPIIIIIIISCHRFSFFPGTSPLEPVVNPTTQASSLSL
jgi:hypothetical protein